jgi:L-rhamnose isomerase/sugar isomerase
MKTKDPISTDLYRVFAEKYGGDQRLELAKKALKNQLIELPSWAVGNSGTRYGTFREAGAAASVWHKIDDCAEIQRHTGICPKIAVHVLWDVTEDGDYAPVRKYAEQKGLSIGTVHPNTFMGQQFKFGSVCNPFEDVRKSTQQHFIDCVQITSALGSDTIGIWLADGTNYPGQDNLRKRKQRLLEGMQQLYAALGDDMLLLVEYKPFEPTFYSTDIMDWGMSLLTCSKLGDRAKVLVDLGHHLPAVNIEQIIAILLDEGRLGGFHLNNCKYADDDLMVGSVNPLELFLIYLQIVEYERTSGSAGIRYMLDQSHNIEPSIEGIIQSVMHAQTAYAKALLVDYNALAEAQQEGDVMLANRIVMDAYEEDVRPLLHEVRAEMSLEPDPLMAYRSSGYADKIARERQGGGINTLGGG